MAPRSDTLIEPEGQVGTTPSQLPPSPQRRQVSLVQRKKNETTRRRLLEAAAKVIGKHGYAGASIARITAKAGVAHGAFYLHFKSQQALFDVLLPTFGAEMLDAISDAVRQSHSLEELEFRGIKTNFDYIAQHPEIYRLMNEAELYAPRAFAQHVNEMTRRYKRSLRRSLEHNGANNLRDEELEVLATMLMGTRSYLLMHYCHVRGRVKPLSDDIVESYVRFALEGIRGTIRSGV